MTITLTDGGIDGGVSPAPQHYMIGCLYPTHAQTALRALRAARPDLVTRVRGLKANASPLSPDELDKLDRLAATDYQIWAPGRVLRNRSTLHRSFSESSASLPPRQIFLKNVTNLGLPRVYPVLHIVCPLDSQRYYLLLTGIHRLLAPLFTTICT